MKKRLISLALMLILVLGMVNLASAASQPRMTLKTGSTNVSNTIQSLNVYTLENKKTATFYASPTGLGNLTAPEGNNYADIIFDTANAVKASCSAKWVHVLNLKDTFFLWYESNNTQKSRTATITVTAKGYKAKIKLIQVGNVKIASIKRNKDTVTVKLKLPKGCTGGSIDINEYMTDSEGYTLSKYAYEELAAGTKTYVFTVKEGWSYSLSIDSIFNIGDTRRWMGYDYGYFTVTSIKGSETITFK